MGCNFFYPMLPEIGVAKKLLENSLMGMKLWFELFQKNEEQDSAQ